MISKLYYSFFYVYIGVDAEKLVCTDYTNKFLLLYHIKIQGNIMTSTSAHYKQVENLM